MVEQTLVETLKAESAAVARTRDPFFVIFASVMVLLVVAGFTRTYYLRPFFNTEQIPTYIHIHGLVLTAWFVLFLLQSILISQRRPGTHKRFGIIGVTIATAVVAISLFTLINVYPLREMLGHDIDLAGSARMAQMTRDLFLLSAFPLFIVLAVVFRRRPQAHKRLMLLGSISLLPAAVGRIFRWPALSEIPEAPATLGVILALVIAVAVHDFAIFKRVHPVVAWGGPIYFLWLIVGALLVEFVVT